MMPRNIVEAFVDTEGRFSEEGGILCAGSYNSSRRGQERLSRTSGRRITLLGMEAGLIKFADDCLRMELGVQETQVAMNECSSYCLVQRLTPAVEKSYCVMISMAKDITGQKGTHGNDR